MEQALPQHTKEREQMKRLKNSQSQEEQNTKSVSGLQQMLMSRGKLQPFLFRPGPVFLSICSVLLISLMAVLYLSQLGQAVTTNQQIQDLQNQQTELQRQNSDLINTIASEQSPAYIATHASQQGLAPTSASNVQVIVVPNIQAQQNGDGSH
jgi:cell division protein FtsL